MVRDYQKERSDKTRQEILDTALAIGLEEGFPAVSVRKISKRMNYSTGVIYHYFVDRQEIIDEIEKAQFDWLDQEIRSILTDKDDIFEMIHGVFYRMMQLAYEESEKYTLIVTRKYSRKSTGTSPRLAMLARHLEKAMSDGRIRPSDPERTAFAIWSSFHGFHLMLSRLPDLTFDEAKERFQVEFDIVTRGLLP